MFPFGVVHRLDIPSAMKFLHTFLHTAVRSNSSWESNHLSLSLLSPVYLFSLFFRGCKSVPCFCAFFSSFASVGHTIRYKSFYYLELISFYQSFIYTHIFHHVWYNQFIYYFLYTCSIVGESVHVRVCLRRLFSLLSFNFLVPFDHVMSFRTRTPFAPLMFSFCSIRFGMQFAPYFTSTYVH